MPLTMTKQEAIDHLLSPTRCSKRYMSAYFLNLHQLTTSTILLEKIVKKCNPIMKQLQILEKHFNKRHNRHHSHSQKDKKNKHHSHRHNNSQKHENNNNNNNHNNKNDNENKNDNYSRSNRCVSMYLIVFPFVFFISVFVWRAKIPRDWSRFV